MKLFPVVNYTFFYKRALPVEPLACIKKYPTDFLIMYLCKTNAAVALIDQSTIQGKAEFYQTIFPFLSNNKRKRIAEILGESATNELKPDQPFFTQQAITWLIAQCFTFFTEYYDLPQSEEAEFQDNLFDSILTANEIFYNDKNSYEVGSFEHFWEITLRQQNYVRDIEAMLKAGTVKMLFFQNFVKKHFKDSDQFFQEFCERLQIVNFLGYSSFFYDILDRVFDTYKNKKEIVFRIKETEETKKIINSFSITASDLKEQKKFKTLHGELIPKPIYLARDEYPLILDYNFLIWLISTALPYNFYYLTSLKENKIIKDFNTFKGILGKYFYEEHLSLRVLSSIFSHAICVPGNKIDDVTDLLIIQDADIFLFEVKSASVNHKILENIDISEFKNFLAKEFLSSKTTQGKNKGVFQISSCINEISKGSINVEKGVLREGHKYSIYPIIIFIDPVLEIQGVNSYCNKYFSEKVDSMRVFFRHIYPLTMININHFLLTYELYKQRPKLLKQNIKEYHQNNAKKNKSYKKTGVPLFALSAAISFDHFMRGKENDENKNISGVLEDFDLLD